MQRGFYENRLRSKWPESMGQAQGEEGGVDSLSGKAKYWEQELERCMAEHPKATLAVAALAGVFIGWLVKRK